MKTPIRVQAQHHAIRAVADHLGISTRLAYRSVARGDRFYVLVGAGPDVRPRDLYQTAYRAVRAAQRQMGLR